MVHAMEQIERALRKAREHRQWSQPARLFKDSAETGSDLNGTAPSKTRKVRLDPAALRDHRVIAGQVHDPLIDLYRSLRAQVLQTLAQIGKTSLGITSATHGEGKTLTAVNLALAIAMEFKRTVLLVDADLRMPAVAQYLGIRPALGLSDYLTGQAEISDCLLRADRERLSILPARSHVGNSAELLTSPRMIQLATELKSRYPDRIVIYDLPPLLSIGDTIGFLPSIDATLLVVRDGATRTAELTRAIELLSDHKLIGTVLNATQ
jgi:capsular exopolysaccharide synthesis family protein